MFSQGVLGATGARGDFGLPGADVSDFCNSCFEFLFFFFLKKKKEKELYFLPVTEEIILLVGAFSVLHCVSVS